MKGNVKSIKKMLNNKLYIFLYKLAEFELDFDQGGIYTGFSLRYLYNPH